MSACRELSKEELNALLDACTGRNGLRDRTFLLLATTTGFRVSETLSLRRKDVVDYRGEVVDEIHIERKKMKGKREGRSAPLSVPMRAALTAHLEKMEENGLVMAVDPLFQIGTKTHRAISRTAVWKMIRRRAEAARISTRNVGTHTTRKTAVDALLVDCNKRGDAMMLMKIKDFLGHAEISSTEKYIRNLKSSERAQSFSTVSAAVFGEAAP